MTEAYLGATRISGPDPCRGILLAGELNPYSSDPRYALYHQPAHSAGGRLQRTILGVRVRQTYLPMWRVDLCVDRWSLDDAVVKASVLSGRLAAQSAPAPVKDRPWRVIVALGVLVSRAFSEANHMKRLELFDGPVEVFPGVQLVSLPHPSGRSYAWSGSAGRESIRRARALLRSVWPGVPWGELDESGSEEIPR